MKNDHFQDSAKVKNEWFQDALLVENGQFRDATKVFKHEQISCTCWVVSIGMVFVFPSFFGVVLLRFPLDGSVFSFLLLDGAVLPLLLWGGAAGSPSVGWCCFLPFPFWAVALVWCCCLILGGVAFCSLRLGSAVFFLLWVVLLSPPPLGWWCLPSSSVSVEVLSHQYPFRWGYLVPALVCAVQRSLLLWKWCNVCCSIGQDHWLNYIM